MLFLVVDTGVAIDSAKTPSENMCVPHSINEWMGGRYFLSNSSRRLLSANKLMFRQEEK